MNDVLIQHFIQLIATNTGLHIREQDKEALSKKIDTRMKLLNFTAPEKYYQLLNTEHNQSDSPLQTLREREWRELILLLTTGESYFFRDKGQITLLKDRILPELILHKKKAQYAEGEAKPSLRIWSAGCSTGEEPYSLAILVTELIPDYNKWNIFILGTDINPESIEKVKRGIYYPWSFRMVDPKLQKRYFYQRQTSWEVNEAVRTMVTFRPGNLIKDHFPNSTSNLHSMDFILCRNVFIYFDSKSISVVLEKFYNTLRPGGYLMAGHTELHDQNLGQLQPKVFPESVVYQRSENLQAKTPVTAIPPTTIVSPRSAPSRTVTSGAERSKQTTSQTIRSASPPQILSQAETLFHNGAYAIAIKEAEQVLKEHPHHFGAYCLMAQAFANLGEYEKAIDCCQQALKVDSLSVNPYYLLAHIAEEQGDIELTKTCFKKIIYLAPSSIAAYLGLGSLHEVEGDSNKARKMRSTALELLKELPPHLTVDHQDEITAGELIIQVKKLLK